MAYFWQGPSSWVSQGAQKAPGAARKPCSGPDVPRRLLQHQGASLEPPAVPGTQEARAPTLAAALQMARGVVF